MQAAVSKSELRFFVPSQKMSPQSTTCSPVEEHLLWEASSIGAASLEDFMAVMCLEIKMGKYEMGFPFETLVMNTHTEKLSCSSIHSFMLTPPRQHGPFSVNED